MAGKFEIKKAKDGQFYFCLKAGNGEIILTSEMYRAQASAVAGIESVQKNAALDERFDRRTSTSGKPYFALRASNGQDIGRSELYESATSRDGGIESVKRNAPETSRATIYNTLNILVEKGLLRQLTLDDGKTVFDPKLDRESGSCCGSRTWESGVARRGCAAGLGSARWIAALNVSREAQSRAILSRIPVVDLPGTNGRMTTCPPACSTARRSSCSMVSMV